MKRLLAATALLALTLGAPATRADDGGPDGGGCGIPTAVVAQIQGTLAAVVAEDNGGIFKPNRMWSAVVDRQGRLCSVIRVGDAWPGSRAIAMAKASTANDFSNDALALSTANLYSATQPGGSLYGLNNSNSFNPAFLVQGNPPLAQALMKAFGQTPGGIITFGGGVPLYSGGKVIGGLGVSGDSACADHVMPTGCGGWSGWTASPPASASAGPTISTTSPRARRRTASSTCTASRTTCSPASSEPQF